MIELNFEKYNTDDHWLKWINIYFKNGLIYNKLDQYIIDNKMDIIRIDDLHIDYDFSTITREAYFQEGKLHNLDGYAFKYNDLEEYWINDQLLSFEQWKNNPERIKLLRKNKFKAICKI